MIKNRPWVSSVLFLIMTSAFFSGIKVLGAEGPSNVPANQSAEENQPQGSFTTLSVSPVTSDQQVIAASGLNERVSLDLRNIELTEALRYLALKGGFNVAMSKTVMGRVQLLLNNVPIKDILDIVLITNGLAYEMRGEVYYIMTETEYHDRFGRKFSDARKVKLFKIKYAVPEQVFATFDVLKSELGRLLVDPESGTVLVMDSQENIERMEKALQALEEKKIVKVYSLKYGKAADIEKQLKTRLENKKVGNATADERTNQVVVETLPDRISEIDSVVQALDQKTREVIIDAKIIKVTMSDNLDATVKWEAFFQQGTNFIGNHPYAALARVGQSFANDFVSIAPTVTPTAGAKNVLTENLFLGKVSKDATFETLIDFLKTLGDTKVLSNPKLAVINNQEAKIHVGQKQAYVTTTTTNGQGINTTAEAVTFVDVGIQLAVTPTINEDGYVTMKVKPEISDVTSFLTTTTGNKIPIIDSSMAETSVMVKDGVSIIIGGLRKDENTESLKKIPFLGDIPILGLPFNSFSTTKTHTELLILITPHIVYGNTLIDDGRQVGSPSFMPYANYTPGNVNKKDVSKGAAVK